MTPGTAGLDPALPASVFGSASAETPEAALFALVFDASVEGAAPSAETDADADVNVALPLSTLPPVNAQAPPPVNVVADGVEQFVPPSLLALTEETTTGNSPEPSSTVPPEEIANAARPAGKKASPPDPAPSPTADLTPSPTLEPHGPSLESEDQIAANPPSTTGSGRFARGNFSIDVQTAAPLEALNDDGTPNVSAADLLVQFLSAQPMLNAPERTVSAPPADATEPDASDTDVGAAAAPTSAEAPAVSATPAPNDVDLAAVAPPIEPLAEPAGGVPADLRELLEAAPRAATGPHSSVPEPRARAQAFAPEHGVAAPDDPAAEALRASGARPQTAVPTEPAVLREARAQVMAAARNQQITRPPALDDSTALAPSLDADVAAVPEPFAAPADASSASDAGRRLPAAVPAFVIEIPPGERGHVVSDLPSPGLTISAHRSGDSSASNGSGAHERDTDRGAEPMAAVSKRLAHTVQTLTSFAALLGSDIAAFPEPAVVASMPHLPNEQAVMSSIVQSMRMQYRDGVGTATLRLDPEFLGGVAISLQVTHGSVTATVRADSPEVRAWLEANEPALRQGLAEQGLSLDRLVVTDDEPAEDRQPPDERRRSPQQGQKNGKSRERRSETATFEVVV